MCANRIKVINFNDSLVTSQAPTLAEVEVATATQDESAVRKDQMEAYVDEASYLVVADIAAIKAISSPADNTVRIAKAEKGLYVFKLGDSSTPDDIHILQDTGDTGRWFREEKIDLTNAQTVAGVKTFSSFPLKSGSGATLNSTLDGQFTTKYYCDNTFATQTAQEAQAGGIDDLQRIVTELAINQEYGEFAGEYGLYTELFMNKDNEDTGIETSSLTLAQINGNLREGLFAENAGNYFQEDRESTYKKTGILQPAPYYFYGEKIDTWRIPVVTNPSGICWDSTREVWWVVDASDRIFQVSEDFSKALGWWVIDNQSNLSDCTVDGNYLYVTDNDYSTYGRVTKHLISSSGDTLGGEASGNSISDSSAVAGNSTYDNPIGICNDGTNLYVVCYDANLIGKIVISTFSAWDSQINIDGFVDDNDCRGIAYDGTDFFISDIGQNAVTKIKIDGSEGYNRLPELYYNTDNVQALEIKNGDLYAVSSFSYNIEKYAIKNTRTLLGQTIGIIPNPETTEVMDLVFVENLLDSGTVDGYLVTYGNMEIKVFEADLTTERTSGTPQSTTFTDGSGMGVTAIWGIDYNSGASKVLISVDGSTNDGALYFDASEMDGNYAFQVSDKILSLGTGLNPRGIAKIPGESNYIIADQSNTAIREGTLAGVDNGVIFELPYYYLLESGTGCNFAFNPNNSRELYLCRAGAAGTGPIIDFPISRYQTNGNQPAIIGQFGYSHATDGITFDANGDIVSYQGTVKLFHKKAVASATDKNLTGLNQRAIRDYGNSRADGTRLKTYPATCYDYYSGHGGVRYRRKYATSAYSSQHNVLPLDGIYLLTNGGLTVIDAETNTEFMHFNKPNTDVNYGVIDASVSVITYYGLDVCDDKIFIASNGGMIVIDFINDEISHLNASGLKKSVLTIQDRNLFHSTSGNIWGSVINDQIAIAGINLRTAHCKQDTSVKPEEHQGTETEIDNSEIYVAYGGYENTGVILWKAGISYTRATDSVYRYNKIADDFSYIEGRIANASGGIYVFGDIRKIYDDYSSIDWAQQTGVATQVFTGFSNQYLNNFDVKTIWKNGIAYHYIVVGYGQTGTSDIRGIEILDVKNERYEILEQASASTAGINTVCFGQDLDVFASIQASGGGEPALRHYKRRDHSTDYMAYDGNWFRLLFDENSDIYIFLHDDIISGFSGLMFSNNTLFVSNDDGIQAIDFPRAASRYECTAYDIDQAEKMFYIANDSSGLPAPSGKARNREIKSDVSDAGFTFTNGSSNSWGSVSTQAQNFGGNYRSVQGQSGGGTQPKVEWTTEDDCTAIMIYVERGSNSGKIDVNVVNTSGNIDVVYDLYSLESIYQDIIVIQGLDAETHAVTLTCRSDKNSLSTDYYFEFTGCVELIETATDRANPTITYSFSNDQDKSTKHWHEFASEAISQYIWTDYQYFSGTGSEDEFQFPSTNLAADIISVEVNDGGWTPKIEETHWNHDTPGSGEITITFTPGNEPPSGTDNIRVKFVQQGESGKFRVDFDYPVGTTGLEKAYVNDIGIYLIDLPAA